MFQVTPRQTFLETIGLALDPFATPVAEQELAPVVAENAVVLPEEQTLIPAALQSKLYSYFTSPCLKTVSPVENVLRALRTSQPWFIYGEPGSGKTSLRLALEADCRTITDHSLVVTNTLGEDIQRPLTILEHRQRLSQALAIDLFIQVVEQFNPLDRNPTDEQTRALARLVPVGGRPLQRLLRVLNQPAPNMPRGLAAYWPAIGKSALRYVPSSAPLRDLIGACNAYQSALPPIPKEDWLLQGLETARLWDFRRVLVLIDGVDTRQRKIPAMFGLISPLLDALPEFMASGIYFKFFLPSELRAEVSARLAKPDLLGACFEGIIEWDNDSLRQLLAQRLRAAGSRYVSFDQLAGPGLKGKLDSLILRSALGSPRRMLRVISALIDEHSTSASQEPKFTIQDWNHMRQSWEYELPLPAES